MIPKNDDQGRWGIEPAKASRRPAMAALLAVPVAALAASRLAHAQQQAWRGLNVPMYPNATDHKVAADHDEYEIRFRSSDNVQAVFDFYRDYLQRQGFRVTDSRPTSHGFKADMVRGSGGPSDTVELDAKQKHGRYKVEIEFDE